MQQVLKKIERKTGARGRRPKTAKNDRMAACSALSRMMDTQIPENLPNRPNFFLIFSNFS
jgi:hypothetical protein